MAVIVEFDPAVREAVLSFVTGYAARRTREAYANDLTLWVRYCHAEALRPLCDVRRTHIERYARSLEEQDRSPSTVGRRLSTIAGFYRWCVDENLVEHSPATNVRRPRRLTESPRAGLTRPELKDWLDAADAEGGQTYALACLLAINGLRIGEICSADITDLSENRWHHTLSIIGKGDKRAVIPLPPRTAYALAAAIGSRTSGPLLLTQWNSRMTRGAAARTVARLARRVGITKHITPH
ncbi:MAG: tyrosine-type recombinase/integrase, partial [Actinomycetota bacterium]|nr:tyrosine-type recombinase/integrase [Actinomycetota bacterium]